MKTTSLLGSLFAVLCLLGCSGGGESAGNDKRLVPEKVTEIVSSPDYKFERTTKSGIQCYVRPLTPEAVEAMPANSPDRAYLTTGKSPFLLVPVRNDRIATLSKDERAEVAAIMIERMVENDPELRKIIRDRGRPK